MTNKFLTTALVAGLAASSLTACTETGTLDSNTLGTVVGGVAGGFLGSQFGEGSGKTVAAIAGALAGAWVGNQVVNGLSTKDRAYYDNAATKAQSAPVGQTITWYNPQSGAQGTITPVREGSASDGAYCREFQQTITVGGKQQKAYGTACRQPDGSWKIVSQ